MRILRREKLQSSTENSGVEDCTMFISIGGCESSIFNTRSHWDLIPLQCAKKRATSYEDGLVVVDASESKEDPSVRRHLQPLPQPAIPCLPCPAARWSRCRRDGLLPSHLHPSSSLYERHHRAICGTIVSSTIVTSRTARHDRAWLTAASAMYPPQPLLST